MSAASEARPTPTEPLVVNGVTYQTSDLVPTPEQMRRDAFNAAMTRIHPRHADTCFANTCQCPADPFYAAMAEALIAVPYGPTEVDPIEVQPTGAVSVARTGNEIVLLNVDYGSSTLTLSLSDARALGVKLIAMVNAAVGSEASL